MSCLMILRNSPSVYNPSAFISTFSKANSSIEETFSSSVRLLSDSLVIASFTSSFTKSLGLEL